MKKEKKVKVVVAQNEEAPVEKSVLAAHILEISRSMRRLEASGINREAIILLTYDLCKPTGTRFNKSKPSRAAIRNVFYALGQLEREYCR